LETLRKVEKREKSPEGGKTTPQKKSLNVQGVFESCAEILTTNYWLHVELGNNI
jgi:hypothetical protein